MSGVFALEGLFPRSSAARVPDGTVVWGGSGSVLDGTGQKLLVLIIGCVMQLS